MATPLLDHLRDDVFCSLGPRSAVPEARVRTDPLALRKSVGVFALRDIPAGSVLDRSVENVDSSHNFLQLGSGTPFPVALEPAVDAEVRARCTHSNSIVLPKYGLNIFRLLNFIQSSEHSNCVFSSCASSSSESSSNGSSFNSSSSSSSKDESEEKDVRIHVTRSKRSGRKRKSKKFTMKKRKIFGPMFNSLVATRLILKGEELLLPLECGQALASNVEKKGAWTPAEKRVFEHLRSDLFCTLGACRYGVGVYAIRAIVKGTIVDHTVGCFDYQTNTLTLPWTAIETAQVPIAVQDQLKKHYQTDEGGLIQIPRHGFNLSRLVAYINHASEGNCDFKYLKLKGYAYIFATRDIAAGEELCINYHLYLSEEQKRLPMFAFLLDELKQQAPAS